MMTSFDITAVILAGGAGTRLGGVDKGWMTLNGSSLVERIIAALQGQVGAIIISANTNVARYAALGYPVIPDPAGAPGGPLAGVFAAWSHVHTPYALLLPVDAAVMPATLVESLQTALLQSGAAIARARVGPDIHPTCALLACARVQCPPRPGGSLMGWQEAYPVVDVPLNPSAVLSVNTPEEFSALDKIR